MQGWLSILIMIALGAGFALISVLLSNVLGPSKPSPEKSAPYECGMPAAGTAQPRFSVKFYLVAMLFILFDIEIVFMYPWAVVYRDHIAAHGPGIFWSMLSFVTVLTVGYVYAIMKGALDWKS